MVPHQPRSHRTFPVVALTLALAATLASCGRSGDTPPAGNRRLQPSPLRHLHRRLHRPPPPRELTWSKKVDMKLWSTVRVKAYKAALQRETPHHARHPAHPAARSRGAGLRRHNGRGARPRRRSDRGHGPTRDAGQRRHRGPPGRVLPGAEGHQGRRRAGAGHARCDRAIPGRVDPDHHPDRRQRDRPDARSGRDARRLLPVLLPGLGAAAVHRARGTRRRDRPRAADVPRDRGERRHPGIRAADARPPPCVDGRSLR